LDGLDQAATKMIAAASALNLVAHFLLGVRRTTTLALELEPMKPAAHAQHEVRGTRPHAL
jgi:hypothetical protein